MDYGQFTNNWSIRKAKQYLQKHDDDLNRTEKAFGVDKKIITAIMLVETGLGASVGTRSTLNTLSTLAALMDPVVREQFWDLIPDSKKISRKKFEKKAAARSKWAYEELKAFLKYTNREGFDPALIPGSFAGAVGVAQFMPTNILAYGQGWQQRRNGGYAQSRRLYGQYRQFSQKPWMAFGAKPQKSRKNYSSLQSQHLLRKHHIKNRQAFEKLI